ncbi:hypothetical protein HPB48_009678 [Haemaphysalis longicornis]|uniref:Uncharacterized protein n=1 Tax=Haemaphysalis longicornis TaxID=44386 RepID=A0A9J6GJ37_HAELO|nr:hypothetical protein HPB48_009678 [Haemaphysalis longicornis]
MKSSNREVCRSHSCHKYARLLADTLDESVNPCYSFTQFVCNGWHQRNQLGLPELVVTDAMETMMRLVDATSLPKVSGREVLRQLTTQNSLVIPVGLGVAVSIIGSLLLLAYLALSGRSSNREVCRSHSCHKYARLLADTLDESVNPCYSFTQFVCNGWHQRNQLGLPELVVTDAMEAMMRLVDAMALPKIPPAGSSAFFGPRQIQAQKLKATVSLPFSYYICAYLRTDSVKNCKNTLFRHRNCI